MKLQYAGYTHKGNSRGVNEDNFCLDGVVKEETDSMLRLTGKSEKEAVFAVSDGIGGEAAGEKASYLAMRFLKRTILDGTLQMTADYIEKMNAYLCMKQRKNRNNHMGCTLVLVKIYGTKMDYINLGDSRLYLVRDSKIGQLSEDHTEYEYLKKYGHLPDSLIARERASHTLLQHLGIDNREMLLEPQIVTDFSLKRGDRLLLCSDGISDKLEDEKIEQILEQYQTPDKASVSLVESAMENGYTDNLTAVAIYLR